MQPESCRFNRGLTNPCPANSIRPRLGVIAEYGKTVETAIDLVPQVPRKREINVALSNSFGFGGTNASVIVQRVAN